jgi:hypothetical protein
VTDSFMPSNVVPLLTGNWDEQLSQQVPRKPWDVFWHEFDPEPGEHIAILGATGQGKTILQKNILPKFPFVAAMATKPQDRSMDVLIEQEQYRKLARWYRLNPIDHPRRVVWPDASRLDSTELQRHVFERAFDLIFREGGRPKHKPVGWAIAIDELWYFTNILGMGKHIKLFLFQARSLGESLVVATQRPSSVPLEVYSQSTHLFFFQDSDKANLDRLAEINARAKPTLMRYTIANLEEHQVLYVNTRTGRMLRTRAPAPIASIQDEPFQLTNSGWMPFPGRNK